MKRVPAVLMGIVIVLAALTSVYATSYTYTSLDYSGATWTEVWGINNAGQIVGGANLPHAQPGFLLSGGVYSALNSRAYGINDVGQIVGQGFLLNGGTYTTLRAPWATWESYPGQNTTVAHGINDAAQIVGVYNKSASEAGGFLLSEGTYTKIDYPGATSTVAAGINNAGEIVGWTGAQFGFLLSGGTYYKLPGVASDINNLGQIVGTTFNHGYLLSGGTYTYLYYPGANFTWATGINDLGQIVGIYTMPGDAFGHGFLATPVPIPGAILLFAPGFAGLAVLRRRLKR